MFYIQQKKEWFDSAMFQMTCTFIFTAKFKQNCKLTYKTVLTPKNMFTITLNTDTKSIFPYNS